MGLQYIVAAAIPTADLPFQRLFLAFNFEAHYGLADAQLFSYQYLSNRDTVFVSIVWCFRQIAEDQIEN